MRKYTVQKLNTLCSTKGSLANAVSRLARSSTAFTRSFAQVKDLEQFSSDIWFTSNAPRWSQTGFGLDYNKPDERTLKLGKTIRELQTRLPTLLQSPLPSDLLSPQITLHLFPSTHPHLPTVSGRIAYVAALWTAPVAWGQIPLIGNVKLDILSERMIRGSGTSGHRSGDEKLVVKWKTCARGAQRDATGGRYRDATIGSRDPVERIMSFLGAGRRVARDDHKSEEDFCGIFIFEFDTNGKIVKHIIDHTEHGEHWDKTTRVVSVTDWLLGKFNGAGNGTPALAYCDSTARRDLRRPQPRD